MTLFDSEEWLAHPGTVGRAAVRTVHIIGEDDRELGPAEEGVVHFSGGRSFGYHNDPEKTASVRFPGGLATMGDVGRLDEEGYL